MSKKSKTDLAIRKRWCSVGGLAVAVALSATSCQSSRSAASALAAAVPISAEHHEPVGIPLGPLPATDSIVLIAIDGVRWQDVFLGVDRSKAEAEAIDESFMLPADRLLPNIFRRVIPRGVAIGAPGYGAPMRASGPNHVSLPGYMELLSGSATTCTENDCKTVPAPTIVDAFRDHFGPEGGAVGVITSWERIERAAAADARGIVMSTGRTGGATREAIRFDPVAAELLDVGSEVGPYPGHGDYRPDFYTAALALRFLWTRRPRFMFVGLGDTDEWAHQDNYEAYLQSMRFADTFVGNVLDTLEMMGSWGARTTVIVTTDHGRSNDFTGHGRSVESGRVWMVARGGSVPALGYVRSPEERHLADIAPTIRSLAGLPEREGGGHVLAEMLLPNGSIEAVASR